MRFYRLEKTNYFKIWGFAVLRSVGLAVLATIILMLCMGYKFLIVSSGSMEPTLPTGSMVIMTPCDYEDIQLGDIITMNASGVLLTHRVAGKKATRLVNNKEVQYEVQPDSAEYENARWFTKGDYWNAEEDPTSLADKVVGKVYESHCFTFTGKIYAYVLSNYKMLVVTALILVAFVIVINYLKGKLVEDDVECYDADEE